MVSLRPSVESSLLMMHSNHSHHTVDVEAAVTEFISLNSSRKGDFGAFYEWKVHVDDAMHCLMWRSDFNSFDLHNKLLRYLRVATS